MEDVQNIIKDPGGETASSTAERAYSDTPTRQGRQQQHDLTARSTAGTEKHEVIWEEEEEEEPRGESKQDRNPVETNSLIKRRREIHSWNEQDIRGSRPLSTTVSVMDHGIFRTPTALMMPSNGSSSGYRNTLRLTTTTAALPLQPTSPRFSLRLPGSRGVSSRYYTNAIGGGGVYSQNSASIPRSIGTQIDEGHQNFVLMYDMLMGIRTTVSRCNAKMNRELTLEDFKARHKLAFDVTGDELTPYSKYAFKFKDYAPWVFRHLREYFNIDGADYLLSLTGKYVLSELGSPGKSGSFFYYSRDYRFIIKTIRYTEHKFLRKILKNYYQHVKDNPHTLLVRFYGLHRVKLPRDQKIHFVIMGNIFPPNKEIDKVYDLKGATYGRHVSSKELIKNKFSVLKDMNFMEDQRKMFLGLYRRRIFLEQIKKDAEFLSVMNIMDYSLLVGIQQLSSQEKAPLAFQQNEPPSTTMTVNRLAMARRSYTSALNLMRKDMHQSSERQVCLFYRNDGGFQSTSDQEIPLDECYFLGIIDVLTPYDLKKKIEHLLKSLTHNRETISAIKPSAYAERFVNFMMDAVASVSEKDYAERKSRYMNSTASTKPRENLAINEESTSSQVNSNSRLN